jgi:RimJ/RimL family protein N-acetyltransferase
MNLVTARLRLRPFTLDDAPFIVALLNSEGWLRFIGDRSVRTIDDARAYLRAGPMAMQGSTAKAMRAKPRPRRWHTASVRST